MNIVLPEEIKRARKRAGLSQKEAAAVIGYGWRAWQEWEGGRRGMRRELLMMFRELNRAKSSGRR